MKKTYEKSDLGKSFALTVCVMLLAQVLLSLAFSPLYDEENNLPDWAFWLMQGLYCLATGGASFIYAKAAKADYIRATTANKKPILSHIVWGFVADLCLICMMVPLNAWVLRFLQSLTGKTYSVEMPMQLVPMIIVSCLLPAVCEELTFRGTIAQSVGCGKTAWGKIGSVALSGALFALIHFNPAQTLHQFVLGALLTLLMFNSGSVWTSVFVHLFNNLVAVALSFAFPDESVLQPYYLWMFIGGAVCFAFAVCGYIAFVKSKRNRNESSNTQTMCDKTDGLSENSEAKTRDSADVESKIYFGISIAVCVLIWALTLFF